MAEYIEREALYSRAYWHGERPDCDHPYGIGVDAVDVSDIDKIPAADVAPVRHGKWVALVVKKENWKGVLHDFYQPYSCSICKNPNTFMGESAFCPHCGAKMDGA